MGTFSAIVLIVSNLLKLAQFITASMHDYEQQGIGRAQAIADALAAAHKDLALADAAQMEADQAHAKDKTDDAFLPDFRRGD